MAFWNKHGEYAALIVLVIFPLTTLKNLQVLVKFNSAGVFFLGFNIFLFYFMVMYDLNLETTQVAISDNAYKNQIHRFLTKSTMYFVKCSLGLPADPPCADGSCFD